MFDLPLLVCSAAVRLFAKQATNSKSGYARAALRERPPEGLERGRDPPGGRPEPAARAIEFVRRVSH